MTESFRGWTQSDGAAEVGLGRMGLPTARDQQAALDRSMREMLGSPPYDPAMALAKPDPVGTRGYGWQPPEPVSKMTNLQRAKLDEWVPFGPKAGEDWRHAMKWLERWGFAESDRRFWVAEPEPEALEWLWRTVKQKLEEGKEE